MADLDKLFQVVNALNQYSSRKDYQIARMTNKRDALLTRIDSANTSQEITNLSNLIKSYDKDITNKGYEEYAIGGIYDDKIEAYKKSDMAYQQAESILQKNLGDKDILYDEIMGMTWEDTTAEIDDLNNMLDSVNEGVKYKHSYKSDKYTATGLKSALKTRIGQLQNKVKIFEENPDAFNVFNPETGLMDDATAKIYRDLQIKILSGNTQDFAKDLDDAKDLSATRYNKAEKGYDSWNIILEKHKQGGRLTSELIADVQSADSSWQGDDASLLSEEFIREQRNHYKKAGDSYNKQFQVYSGDYYTKSTPWGDAGTIPGLETDDPASLTGKGSLSLSKERHLGETEEEYRTRQEKAKEIIKEQEAQKDVGYEEGEVSDVKFTASEEEKLADTEYAEGAVSTPGPLSLTKDQKEWEEVQRWKQEYFKDDPDTIKQLDAENEISKIDAESEDVSRNIPQKVLAGAASYALLEDKVRAVGTYTKTQVVKGAKYIRATAQISGANIDRLMNDKFVDDAIKELEGLKKKTEELTKGTKEWKQANSKLERRRYSLTKKFAKKYRTQPRSIERLFNNKSRWSLFNLKADITTRMPKASAKIFGSVGKVAGPFATGSMIAEALGADTWGEKITGGVVGLAAAKKFWPKVVQIVKSPQGKKWLVKKVGAQAAKKIGTSVVAGGGWFSLITGLAGTGLAAYDIYNAIKNFKAEDLEE